MFCSSRRIRPICSGLFVWPRTNLYSILASPREDATTRMSCQFHKSIFVPHSCLLHNILALQAKCHCLAADRHLLSGPRQSKEGRILVSQCCLFMKKGGRQRPKHRTNRQLLRHMIGIGNHRCCNNLMHASTLHKIPAVSHCQSTRSPHALQCTQPACCWLD